MKSALSCALDEYLSPIFPAATAPFPKSRASYFRFARFNTFPQYYLRAWHRLLRDSRASETRARVKITPHIFPAASRFSRVG